LLVTLCSTPFLALWPYSHLFTLFASELVPLALDLYGLKNPKNSVLFTASLGHLILPSFSHYLNYTGILYSSWWPWVWNIR
jgi:hypothetical protein